jgi:hypothetical protein
LKLEHYPREATVRTLIPLALAAWMIVLCPCWASGQDDPCAVSPSGCSMGEEKVFKEMDSDSQKRQQEEQQRYIDREKRLQQEEEEDQERHDNEEDDRRIRREEENR